jgi:hypothetical protein
MDKRYSQPSALGIRPISNSLNHEHFSALIISALIMSALIIINKGERERKMYRHGHWAPFFVWFVNKWGEEKKKPPAALASIPYNGEWPHHEHFLC